MFSFEDLANIQPTKTRISAIYDSTYHIILSSIVEELSELMVMLPYTFEDQSYIDGKQTKTRSFDKESLSPELFKKLKFDPTSLMFKDKKILTRPFITISIVDESDIVRKLKDGTPAVPINTDIKLCVKYNDPDNIGFDKIFSQVKLKDRAEFIEVPSMFALDPITKTYEFTVRSNFPGISVIRAKDTMYLCEFVPLRMRFIP